MSSQDFSGKNQTIFPGLFSEAAPVAEEQPENLTTPESLTLAGRVGHSLPVIREQLLRL